MVGLKRKHTKLIPGFLIAIGLTSFASLIPSTPTPSEEISQEAETTDKTTPATPGFEVFFAKERKFLLTPEWTNGDYLNSVHAPPAEKPLNDYIFDQNITREMSERYNNMTSPYNAQRPYGIDVYSEEKDRLDQDARSRDMADWTMRRLMQYHFEMFLNEPPKSSPTLQRVSKTMKTVNNLQNQSVEIRPDTKAKFKFDLPASMARLMVTSPIIDTGVEYKMKNINPLVQNPGEENLYLTASKELKPIETSTHVQYSVMNDQLNYGAARSIYGPLRAHVDRNNYLREPSRDETIYRVTFGIAFPY